MDTLFTQCRPHHLGCVFKLQRGAHRARLQCPAPACAASSSASSGKPGQLRFAGAGHTGTATFSAAGVVPSPPALWWDARHLQQRLASGGLAALVAYGIFNTLYYSAAFLFFFVTLGKVERGQGLAAAAQGFVQTMAIVWAGSQVTKAPRAAGALLLAPAVDRLLGAIRDRLKLRTKRNAFLFVVLPGCFCFACLLFGTVVVLAA